MSMLRFYLGWVAVGTLLTGTAGIVYQVIWQRYLTYLIGSDARSISLVVACFLFGLALGYRYWGKLTQRGWGRRKLLRTYGFIEIAIGLYAVLFPFLFHGMDRLSLSFPNHIFFDFLMSLVLLFIPTFLMGGTVPILTSVIPTRAEEVHRSHALIYGINSAGAALGAFLSGFYLIQEFGLPLTCTLAGVSNILIGLFFCLNKLEGFPSQVGKVESVPNRLGAKGVFTFVFIVGAVSIATEILLVRIFSLTVGAGFYVFPIVLGVFIFGLALGSLSLSKKRIDRINIANELLKSTVLLVILYFSVPYWPYWFSHVRVSLRDIPSNHGVFLAMIGIFFATLLLPWLFHMGRLLPLGFALMRKEASDYGNICGRIYFANTLGTVFGAVFLSHLLLYFLNIDSVFLILLTSLAMLLFFFAVSEKSGKRYTFTATLIILGIWLAPRWERAPHEFGLFRLNSPQEFHFKGLFKTPYISNAKKRIWLDDGPNTTVSILGVDDIEGRSGKSIMVNGKSDGSTTGDYSTMILTGTLPYLFGPDRKDLQIGVIGLGTGMTAGILAQAEDVGQVEIYEISRSVINANRFFQEDNFSLLKNEKVTIHETDAFKFLKSTKDKIDVLVSEPSNPWVMGVESLFSKKFYELVSESLRKDGVFFQWIQGYSIDNEILAIIFKNAVDVFSDAKFYQVGSGDFGILLSKKKISAPNQARFFDPPIREVHRNSGFENLAHLNLIELYGLKELKWITRKFPFPKHDIDHPILSFLSSQARFLSKVPDLGKLLGPNISRFLLERKASRLKQVVSSSKREDFCGKDYSSPFCLRFNLLSKNYEKLKDVNHRTQLLAYQKLREQGYLLKRGDYLSDLSDEIVLKIRKEKDMGTVYPLLLQELAREGMGKKAKDFLKNIDVDPVDFMKISRSIDRVQNEIEELRRFSG